MDTDAYLVLDPLSGAFVEPQVSIDSKHQNTSELRLLDMPPPPLDTMAAEQRTQDIYTSLKTENSQPQQNKQQVTADDDDEDIIEVDLTQLRRQQHGQNTVSRRSSTSSISSNVISSNSSSSTSSNSDNDASDNDSSDNEDRDATTHSRPSFPAVNLQLCSMPAMMMNLHSLATAAALSTLANNQCGPTILRRIEMLRPAIMYRCGNSPTALPLQQPFHPQQNYDTYDEQDSEEDGEYVEGAHHSHQRGYGPYNNHNNNNTNGTVDSNSPYASTDDTTKHYYNNGNNQFYF
jgi:hypothetical protein